MVAPASRELDVRDQPAVAEAIQTARAAAVVHLAYRRSERDTIEHGSRAVAAAAEAARARLVHLSTDVVFGGRAQPYGESDEPHPIEDYGSAKAAAEAAVAAAAPGAVLVRTSLLLGDPADPGQPERDVRAALTGERDFTFFTDEVRCPARADDVAAGVLALAGAMREVAGPLHLAGPEALTRAELAARLAERMGLDPSGVRSATLAESGQAGRRPGRVVLDCSRADTLGLRCRPV